MTGCFHSTALGAAMALMLPLAALAETQVVTHSVAGDFDDVRLDLESAIIDRGLVIDYEAFVGEMLNRTAADLGATEQVYLRAESLQFCSAQLSRKIMEADPTNLGYCPHIVFAFERPGEAGTVHVGYRRLPETGSDANRAALAEVNALMDAIVRQAAGID